MNCSRVLPTRVVPSTRVWPTRSPKGTRPGLISELYLKHCHGQRRHGWRACRPRPATGGPGSTRRRPPASPSTAQARDVSPRRSRPFGQSGTGRWAGCSAWPRAARCRAAVGCAPAPSGSPARETTGGLTQDAVGGQGVHGQAALVTTILPNSLGFIWFSVRFFSGNTPNKPTKIFFCNSWTQINPSPISQKEWQMRNIWRIGQ